MYDTVNFWVGREAISINPLLFTQYLTDIQERNSEERGYSISGQLDNYMVFASESGISLKGSLSKFLAPTNIHTLTRSTTKEAIQKLSDTIHLPLCKAKVTRVDVSTIFVTTRPPIDYYPFLGNKPHAQRIHVAKETLSYNTAKKQFVLYDKAIESKSKGVSLPMGFDGANILRMELRLIERLPTQLKRPEVNGGLLSDEAFYMGVVDMWGKEYYSIDKLKSISMDATKIKNAKDCKDAIVGLFLQEKGIEFIDNLIKELKAKESFNDRKMYSRLRSDLIESLRATTTTDQNELIKELDQAVKDRLMYCR